MSDDAATLDAMILGSSLILAAVNRDDEATDMLLGHADRNDLEMFVRSLFSVMAKLGLFDAEQARRKSLEWAAERAAL